MKKFIFYGLFLTIILGGLVFPTADAVAQTEPNVVLVHMFGREDCKFCQAERSFLDSQGIVYEYLDVVEDEDAAKLFNQVAEKHELSKVTPLIIIGKEVIQGFNSNETTGARILAALESEKGTDILSVEDHLQNAPKQTVLAGAGCDKDGIECNVESSAAYVFDLPFIGLVDLRTFSLFTLSIVLGTIDGFNPCAIWVLVTFLVHLS